MDDWHRRLASALTEETAGGRLSDAEAALEIAFGHARSMLAYALELSRAHRIPVEGNASGDSIWMGLGDGRIRFTLNRRQGEITVLRPGYKEAQITLAQAEGVDLGRVARDAIDGLVATWRALPAAKKRPNVPTREVDDEPTRA